MQKNSDKIQAELRLRQLAWHLYRYMTLNAMSAVKTGEFPDITTDKAGRYDVK